MTDIKPHLVTTLGIDLQHLRFAVAADDCRSFRKAADFLLVKHSVLSRSIGQFEHLIGAPLFERTSGGVRPTVTGRGVLKIARLALDQIDTLVETGRSAGRGEVGRLSIGFSTSMSTGNLRATLLEFKRRFPQIDLMTVERPQAALANALQVGTVDIVVSPGRLLLTGDKASPLWSERLLVSLPTDHALVTRDSVFWSDLRNETILLSKHDLGHELEDILVSKFLSPDQRPKVSQHDVGRDIVKSLASMGLGVCLVLESEIGATFTGLTYRELQDGTGPTRVGFYAHWGDSENRALEQFIKLLAERYPKPSQAPGR
ncbi:LysR family transcriptional regulator [Bradyrhizobium sp. USDA 3256]